MQKQTRPLRIQTTTASPKEELNRKTTLERSLPQTKDLVERPFKHQKSVLQNSPVAVTAAAAIRSVLIPPCCPTPASSSCMHGRHGEPTHHTQGLGLAPAQRSERASDDADGRRTAGVAAARTFPPELCTATATAASKQQRTTPLPPTLSSPFAPTSHLPNPRSNGVYPTFQSTFSVQMLHLLIIHIFVLSFIRNPSTSTYHQRAHRKIHPPSIIHQLIIHPFVYPPSTVHFPSTYHPSDHSFLIHRPLSTTYHLFVRSFLQHKFSTT
jgi:hypothetical protein